MPATEWVSIDPETNKIVEIFWWDGVCPIGEAPYTREQYDENKHPPMGYDLEVGFDWKERYKPQRPALEQASSGTATPDAPASDTP